MGEVARRNRVRRQRTLQPREPERPAQGVRCAEALTRPLDNLESNWAYMVMVALAWNLKAWWALWPTPPLGRWLERFQHEQATVLRMEFKTFLHAFVWLPCQIIEAGRRLIYRALQLESVAASVLPHLRTDTAMTESYRSRSLDAPVRRGIAGTSRSGRKVSMSKPRTEHRTPPGAGRFSAPTESLEINQGELGRSLI